MNLQQIDQDLESRAKVIADAFDDLFVHIHSVHKHLDELYETDSDPIQTRNLCSWLYKAEGLLTDKVLQIPDELLHLRKDWQLKMGTWDDKTKEWKYD
jgi:predicted small metal-binding protein